MPSRFELEYAVESYLREIGELYAERGQFRGDGTAREWGPSDLDSCLRELTDEELEVLARQLLRIIAAID